MGGVYTVYAYFNGEQIQGILNAVVMLVGSGGVDGDYLSIVRVAAMLGMFMAITYGFVKARGEDSAHYMIMVAIFYSTLFVPRVTVTIEEHGGASGAPTVVDNVPLGLAFFASTTSHIGYWLTEKTETFFSLPDTSLRLSQHGLMGGPRALRETQSAAMPDPVLAQDIINFMRDCINPELVLSPAAVDSLMKSTNIWADLTALNLINPGRMVSLAGTAGAVQCDTAYTTTIGTRLAPAAATEFTRIAQMISPSATPAAANTILGSMLPAAEGLIMTASASTTDAIRQRMMINMLNDTSSSMAQVMNDPSAAQAALGHAMAASNANTSYIVMAKLAQETLPLVRNAIELIVIGVFPIVLLLIIIAGAKGGLVLRSYVMTMLWVQLWAPLYAIVNYVGTMAGAKSMKAALAGVDGISIVNAAQLVNTTISGEAMAGMLTVAVPMIALALIKAGEAAMAGISSSLAGPAERAAAKTGEQVGSGNISMGNTSWGNYSTNNSTSNKSDDGFGYANPNQAKISEAGYSYGVDGQSGQTVNFQKAISNAGVGGQHGSKVEAGNTQASGVQAATTTSKETNLTSKTGGGWTQSDAAVAQAVVAKAVQTVTGTSTTSSDAAGTAMTAATTQSDNTMTSVKASESSTIGSNLKTSGQAGESAAFNPGAVTGAAGAASAGTGSGAAVIPAAGAVPAAAATTTTGLVQKAVGAIGSAASRVAKFGMTADTGLAVKTGEAREHAANTSNGSEQKAAVEQKFAQVVAAIRSDQSNSGTTGSRAATENIIGQLARGLDSTYGTKTASTLTSNASNTDQRGSSISASTSTNDGERFFTKALEMSGGNVAQANKNLSNPEFKNAVARSVGQEIAQANTPSSTSLVGMDGTAIVSPSSVNGERRAGLSAVEAVRPGNDAAATAAAGGYRAVAKQASANLGIPDVRAQPDSHPIERDVATREGDVATQMSGQKLSQGASGAINRVTRAIHEDNSGMARELSNAFAGGSFSVSNSPDQISSGLVELYKNDTPSKALIDGLAQSGNRASQEDITFLAERAKTRF